MRSSVFWHIIATKENLSGAAVAPSMSALHHKNEQEEMYFIRLMGNIELIIIDKIYLAFECPIGNGVKDKALAC